MKRLGRTWAKLHKFVYLAGILVIIHYVWLVKSDIREPLIYGGVVLLLLAARIPYIRKKLSRVRQHRFIRKLHQTPASVKRKMTPKSIEGSVESLGRLE
jgi:sulfoxide reductase heme-binding subunit YedZ